ncbi:hypothetical protein GCM10027271_53830 [Saccharopolyspora gloriosae]|uniref:Uncharacterized protein n=1 Tax=Saccharopolyspora gloriosae TaxID=455344 RepID=A0A840NHW1_9PSEU|nr:hypothetical protein [Saccharopolyspora gloriosae]MBB5068762.1 hypothetical protein [Saccharopolyspora gloriosae]
MPRSFSVVLKALLGVVVLCVVVLVVVGPSSVALHEEVLHAERSQDAGVTYEYGGSRYSSDLYLLRILRPTGVEYELHLGPHAEVSYYPVEVGFGAADEPRIHDVRWLPDGVRVLFASGEALEVPADNFRSVR